MRALLLLSLLALGSCSASEASESRCAARRPGWTGPQDGIPHHAITNRISRPTMQTVRWNGQEITRATLIEYLRVVRTLRPATFTILDPGTNTDCAILESVRQEIEQTGVCQIGGCGEGSGRWASRYPEIDENSAEYLNAVAVAEAALNAQEPETPR